LEAFLLGHLSGGNAPLTPESTTASVFPVLAEVGNRFYANHRP
jgi:hypothetical protein